MIARDLSIGFLDMGQTPCPDRKSGRDSADGKIITGLDPIDWLLFSRIVNNLNDSL